MAEHPVITLLVKRMESHPEEFLDGPLRWEKIVNDARAHAVPHDRDVLQAAFSAICMDRVYEQAMDELLTGPERRAEAERKREEALALQRVMRNQPQGLNPNSALGSVLPMQALGSAHINPQDYASAQHDALRNAVLYGTGITAMGQADAQRSAYENMVDTNKSAKGGVYDYLKDYLKLDRDANDAKKARKRSLLRSVLRDKG